MFSVTVIRNFFWRLPMSKVMLALTVVVVSCVATYLIAGDPASETLNAMEQARLVKEKDDAYQVFKQVFDETMNELGKGRISLRTAHSRICTAAREFNPNYIAQVSAYEPGANDDERVANNLVANVRGEAESDTQLALRVADLEAELVDF